MLPFWRGDVVARYKLRMSYHGGPFHGFAPQKGDLPTVGDTLRAALEQVVQHETPIVCAGRTDAGVHALDQVVAFDTDKAIDLEALRTSLNALCKPHIVISEVARVPDSFDARFSCTGRAYRYRILNQRLPDPFRRDFTWRVAQPLDVAAMQAAGEQLLGLHDFSSFCRRQFHTEGDEPLEKSRTRELTSVDWVVQPDNEIHLEISAVSFCQQMVRSITGLCVDVGLGLTDVGAVDEILAAKDRNAVPRVAPPQGLFLVAVSYPEM